MNVILEILYKHFPFIVGPCQFSLSLSQQLCLWLRYMDLHSHLVLALT